MFKVDSLVTSENIINMLLNDERSKDIDAYIEAYQNGREQGHIIMSFGNKFAYYICEGRRSDSITIYKGDYSMQSISEDAYNHSNNFGRNFDKAVSWLIEELKEEENKNN